MTIPRRALPVTALLLAISLPALSQRDAATLFRGEVAAAEKAMRWRGPELTDETRFAVAAGGLSWKATAAGQPLIREEKKRSVYAGAEERMAGFREAQRTGDEKAAFAFGLSVLLDPPRKDAAAWREAHDYLRAYGSDLDRALMGVLLAPDKLPLFPSLRYAAADAFVWRASPRTLPLLLTMASSGDNYLRSRGVAGLGVAAYRARGEKSDTNGCGVSVPLREWSVSAVQQGMIADLVRKAARDGSYHVRGAAALAMGLMGDDRDVRDLDKLAHDPAYLAHPEGGKDARRVVFPVRAQAAVSLARFGRTVEAPDGTYSGK